MKRNLALILILLASSLAIAKKAKLREGSYRAVLTLDEAAKLKLPFTFELSKADDHYLIVIRNGDERTKVDEISTRKDSVFFRMPVFDTEFRARVTSGGMEGFWINHCRKEKYKIPFRAEY